MAQARDEIDKKYRDFEERNATFVFENKIIEIKIKDLGVDFDRDATFNDVYLLGRPGRIFKDLALNVLSVFKTHKITSKYSIDYQKLGSVVTQNFGFLEKPAQNADINYSDGKVLLAESRYGSGVDRSRLIHDLALRLDRLSEEPINVVVVDKAPSIESWQVEPLIESLERVLTQRAIFAHGFETWKLEGAELLPLLSIQKVGSTDDYFLRLETDTVPIKVLNVSFVASNAPDLEVGFNREHVQAFLNDVAKVVDRQTVNATAKFDGERIVEFTPAIDGQRLDRERAQGQILSFLFDSPSKPGQEFSIDLPVEITTARVDNEKINSLGIKELIGKGVSYFVGSIENRVFNIELAAKRISGTLIAPGEAFSFNDAVGEISGKTGYKQAYVISAGRTVLDDGGGVCQVSTTIFRAALNSGLPIVARTAHAYRVGYYEQKSLGPGLDATVFSPAVDFKFKNDTPHYVLVQSIFSRATRMLEIDIYGTLDGRTVELGKPVVSSRTPAPPEIRQDDPTLPKGTVKQVDFAAEGADVYFTRKVTKNGQIIFDDTFRSRYKPWQAIFLVGTGG